MRVTNISKKFITKKLQRNHSYLIVLYVVVKITEQFNNPVQLNEFFTHWIGIYKT